MIVIAVLIFLVLCDAYASPPEEVCIVTETPSGVVVKNVPIESLSDDKLIEHGASLRNAVKSLRERLTRANETNKRLLDDAKDLKNTILSLQKQNGSLTEENRTKDAIIKRLTATPVASGKQTDVAVDRSSGSDGDNSISGLPMSFSLRSEYERLGLDAVSQGRRGACTIFATLGVIEFHCAKAGNPAQLSEQFAAWASNKVTGRMVHQGYYEKNIIAGIKEYGICREDLMPYKNNASGNPSKEAKEDALTRKSVSVTWFHDGQDVNFKPGFSDDVVRALLGSILNGDPVSVALEWPRSPKLDKEFTMGCDRNRPSGNGHVIVLVGYEINDEWPGGGRAQIKNSWGEDWGQDGYAWITFEYLKKNGTSAFAVRIF